MARPFSSARPWARPAQFEVMVSFMERHGDLNVLVGKDPYARIETVEKWNELTNLLNNRLLGESRTVLKWKKCWSDFKNNTKRKVRKVNRNQLKVGLTDLEKRVLELVGIKEPKETAPESDNNSVFMIIKDEVDSEEPEQCERTSSSPPEPSMHFFPETNVEVDPQQPEERERTMSQREQPRHFCREAGVKAARQRNSSTSSSSTSSHTEPPPAKRKKRFKTMSQPEQPRHFCREAGVKAARQRNSSTSTSSHTEPPSAKRNKRFKDTMKDLTEIYLEFERERAKMAHEREMARIKQNDQLVTVFGRIVNFVENLAPSIQSYLDRGSNNNNR